MQNNIKKAVKPLFALTLAFSLVQPTFANAEELEQPKAVVTAEDGSKIGFGVPESKSKSFFVTKTDTLESEVEVKESANTLEQSITVEPTNSNSTIEVPLELQEGDYIVLGEDSQGEADGAALIYNEQDESIGVISSPVVDGEDLDISSVDVKDGATLQYTVESKELSEPTNLVVAAAATYYSSYFSSGSWITRDGLISLSMTHKSFLFSGTTNDRAMKLSDSWNKLRTVHSTNSKWKNTNGMYDQYACHYGTIGSAKNPWNLEPSRPDVSYAATVAAFCNPK